MKPRSRTATAGSKRLTKPPALPLVLVLALLPACEAGLPVPGVGTAEVIEIRSTPPESPSKEVCWGDEASPAVIETVTEQVVVQPGKADGGPAIYRSDIKQNIVRERQELWFRTPCPTQMTPDFIASLQRSLQARGHYRGDASGIMDEATRKAVRRYQRSLGLDSGRLSLAAARKLGLVAVEKAPEALVTSTSRPLSEAG